MAHGFLVLDQSCVFDQSYTDTYLELREKLFNLAKACPQWRIPKGIDPVFKIPRIELQSANIGLVRTYDEAELLMNKLKENFPKKKLEIIISENNQADELSFYSVH